MIDRGWLTDANRERVRRLKAANGSIASPPSWV
jgi:hypothetical protein